MRAEKNYLFDIDSINYKRNFHQGLELYQNKSYRAAIEKFLSAMKYSSDNALVRYYLGAAYYKAGYLEDALLQWETLIKLGKHDNYLLNKINQIYYSLGSSKNTDSAFKDYVSIASYPKKRRGVTERALDFPTALWVDDRDNIFVMDAGRRQLLEMNGNGEIQARHISKFLLPTSAKSLAQVVIPVVQKPFDFVLTARGNYYLTDFKGNKIVAFTSNKIKWTVTNGQYHSILGPQGITVGPEGNLYFTDIGNAKIHVYNQAGRHLQSFGNRGSAEGDLLLPTDILYHQGAILVLDKGNLRVSFFDPYGTPLKNVADKLLKKPRSMAIYRDDQIVIVDSTLR